MSIFEVKEIPVATDAMIALDSDTLKNMRPKIERNRKHRARGVSLPPDMESKALKRCNTLDVTFSKYVQKLIAVDLDRQTLSVVKAA